MINKTTLFLALFSFWILLACLTIVLFKQIESQKELTNQLELNEIAVNENTEAYHAMIIMLGNCQI